LGIDPITGKTPSRETAENAVKTTIAALTFFPPLLSQKISTVSKNGMGAYGFNANTVPAFEVPPLDVVPYSIPSLLIAKPATGSPPSS
jgi:hypothetical protein